MDNENVKISASRRMRRSVINFGRNIKTKESPVYISGFHNKVLRQEGGTGTSRKFPKGALMLWIKSSVPL